MAQTVSLSTKAIDEILKRLDGLTQEVKAIKERIFDEEPLYGSDEWWEWSEKKADEDIKARRVHGPFKTAKELQKFLDSLK